MTTTLCCPRCNGGIQVLMHGRGNALTTEPVNEDESQWALSCPDPECGFFTIVSAEKAAELATTAAA